MRKRSRTFKKSSSKHDLSSSRRRKKHTKSIFYSVLVLLLVAGMIGLARLDTFQIKEVKVRATNRANASAISEIAKHQIAGAYLGIFPRSNLLFYPRDQIEKIILDSQPGILSAQVKTDFAHTMTITVKERLAQSLWCKNENSCYVMDGSGIIFATDEGIASSAMVKYYGLISGNPIGKRYGQGDFSTKMTEFITKMHSLGFEVVSVSVIDGNNSKMFFSDGSYLQFLPYQKDKSVLFDNISLFINDLRAKNGGTLAPFEYIDARYDNKIFYKPLTAKSDAKN